jgi:hypothetical protein
VTPPEPELTVTVHGHVGHRRVESVRAPVEDLRLAWMAEAGVRVEEGEVIARYDTELLELWLRSTEEDLAVLERQMKALDLDAEAKAYELRVDLEDVEADHRALKLEYELSKDQDAAERAILERELELSRETLAEARKRLDAVRSLASLGGAAAAEVRDAMAAYERALASVKVPEIKLKEFDIEDGSDERLLLAQDMERLGLKLGGEAEFGSLRSRLAVAIADHEQEVRSIELKEQRLGDEKTDVEEVVDDAVYRSESGGVLSGDSEHSVPLVPGAVLGARQLNEVLPASEALIKVIIPEVLREAVRAKGDDPYKVLVRIPSIDDIWLNGRLTTVSVVKQNDQGIKPNYEGFVELDDAPDGLTFGAGVECRVRVSVPENAVVIPVWWAGKGFRPTVRLAGGETRRLAAQVVGDWLLVSDGLKVGEKIRLPEQQKRTPLVLYSTVEAPDREEVKLRFADAYKWVIEERADDGIMVEAGQVVARVRRKGSRTVRDDAAELEQLKADAALFLARRVANGKLGSDFMDWQRWSIAAETARLEYAIARREDDDSSVVGGQVAARLAEISRQRAEEDHERQSAAAYDEILSANQRAKSKMGVQVARLRVDKAQLQAASAGNFRSSTSVWAKRQAWLEAAARADKEKLIYRRAVITHRNKIAKAEAEYQEAMIEVERLRNDAGQNVLTTPVAGRLFHNNEGWNSIDVGDRVRHRHLFNIPTTGRRQFIINLPSRLYGELNVGDTLPFYMPAVGMKRHEGKVLHVADFFEKRSYASARMARNRHYVAGGTDSRIERTVRVKVDFEVDDISSAPPGMTVVVELEHRDDEA